MTNSPVGAPPVDRLGLVLALVMIVFFATAPNLARLAFDDGIGVISFQVVRFVVAVTTMTVLALILRWPIQPMVKHWRGVGALSLVTIVASFGYMTSVRYIPVGLASLIFFCFPILVAVLAHVSGHERVSGARALSLAIAFAGVVLIFGVSWDAADPRGMALALVAGLAVAIGYLVSRRMSEHLPSTSLSLGAIWGAAVFYITLGVIIGDHQWPASAIGWGGVLGAAIAYVIGLTALYATIARLGSVRSAAISNLEPLVTIAIAFLLLGERLTPSQLLGGAVVIGALFFARR
jgi:drug/metabolite transporter (DMT)-like permease